ncbi:MAG: ABC-type transport auxiliary lipoprotein family protein [Roseicyclus sp.]
MPKTLLPLVLMLPLALGGCGAVSALGSATEALEIFDLSTPADLPLRQGAPQRRDVIVEVPTTGGALDTDRIMLRPTPLQAQYLPGIRWSEEAPVMLQTLMLRALDRTGAFQYVGRRPLGPGGDFAVVSELVEFEAVLLPGDAGAQVEVRMISRIVREQGVQIVATRTFAARELAPSLEDTDIAAAFDAATGRVISEFTVWTLSTLGAI